MKKRVLSLLLCLVMMALLIPTTAFAANIASGSGWYLDTAGCLHLTGPIHNPSTGQVSGDPDSPWSPHKDKIISVVAEKGSSIDFGTWLFNSCENLESVD